MKTCSIADKKTYAKTTFIGSIEKQKLIKEQQEKRKIERYRRNQQNQHLEERKHVRIKQKMLQEELQSKQHQKKVKILEQLYLQLQKTKQEKAMYKNNYLRSFQRAQEQNQIKKNQLIKKENRRIQNQQKAQERFQTAIELRRFQVLQSQEQQANLMGFNRRKLYNQVAQQERQKAIQYKQILQRGNKQLLEQSLGEKQKQTYESYNKNLPRAVYLKNLDFSKTRMHNPIILKTIQQTQNGYYYLLAMIKALKETQTYEDLKAKRQIQEQERVKRVQLNCRNAFRKMHQQQYLQSYNRQTTQRSKQRRLAILQQGKKNPQLQSFCNRNLRPTTLLQQEINKKQRNQDQFQQKFFGEKAQWLNDTISQTTINKARQFQHSRSKLVDESKSIKAVNKQKERIQLPKPKKLQYKKSQQQRTEQRQKIDNNRFKILQDSQPTQKFNFQLQQSPSLPIVQQRSKECTIQHSQQSVNQLPAKHIQQTTYRKANIPKKHVQNSTQKIRRQLAKQQQYLNNLSSKYNINQDTVNRQIQQLNPGVRRVVYSQQQRLKNKADQLVQQLLKKDHNDLQYSMSQSQQQHQRSPPNPY